MKEKPDGNYKSIPIIADIAKSHFHAFPQRRETAQCKNGKSVGHPRRNQQQYYTVVSSNQSIRKSGWRTEKDHLMAPLLGVLTLFESQP